MRVPEMELIDAQMSLWLSAFPRKHICTQNPCSFGTTTHRKLTTVQLSLQFSLSSPCHAWILRVYHVTQPKLVKAFFFFGYTN